MRLGLRARLLATMLVLFGGVGGMAGLFLDARLHAALHEQIVDELTQTAALGAHALADGVEAAPSWTDRVEGTLGARATVIDRTGRVLADSAAQPELLDNHADRPEIVEALEHGTGAARRHSTSLDVDMQYVAVAYGPPDAPLGVFRVALPLSEVSGQVRDQRLLLLLVGLLGLLAALAASAVGAHLVTADLRALVARIEVLVREAGHERPAGRISTLTGSVDRVADELRSIVGELAEERDRFRAVLDAMEEGVLAVDPKGVLSEVNPAARALLGLREHPSGDVLAVTGLSALAAAADSAREGQAQHFELALPAPPRSGGPSRTRQLRVRATPRGGGGAVLVLDDVTEVRRLSTARQQFASNVAHELRTPVAVLKSSAEALVDGALDDPDHGPRFATAVLRHADRLGSLIEDLLQLSRLDAGQRPLEAHAVHARPVALEVVDELSERAAERGQEVVVDIPADLRVIADAGGLHQVLANLVENALKYTPEGGNVWVVGRPRDGTVHLEVRDDGPGIPVEHRQRVFERFYRVDPGRSRQMGGTGLGLAIVKHLVEAMGGSVAVVEPHGPGAVLRVELTAGRRRSE